MGIKIKSIIHIFIFVALVGQAEFVFARETVSRTKSSSVKSTKLNKPKPPKDPGQKATVSVDGSAIYEYPNFDSPVLEYLDQGKSVKVSKKIYPGIGGLGAFYKIRIRPGVFGYITDTDVKLNSKSSGRASVDDRDDDEDMGDDDPTRLMDETKNEEDADSNPENSLYMIRYLGLAAYNFNYSEVLRNQTETSATSMFGVKYTGPTGAMGGMPLDINLMFTATAPSFYNEIASSTTGVMLIGDAVAMIPLYDSRSYIIYYGAGLMLRYSTWKVLLKQQPGRPALDSVELAVGAVGDFGLAVRLSRQFLIRADAKYYYEKEKYFGLGAAIQYKY